MIDSLFEWVLLHHFLNQRVKGIGLINLMLSFYATWTFTPELVQLRHIPRIHSVEDHHCPCIALYRLRQVVHSLAVMEIINLIWVHVLAVSTIPIDIAVGLAAPGCSHSKSIWTLCLSMIVIQPAMWVWLIAALLLARLHLYLFVQVCTLELS